MEGYGGLPPDRQQVRRYRVVEDFVMKMDTPFRNAVWDPQGTITCEIEHPDFGWIPFTASPDDVEPHGRAIFEVVRHHAVQSEAGA
jgi:hypothetical protein